jgi:hypothetical protein
MNPIFRNARLHRYATKSLFLSGLFLTVLVGTAQSSSAQCCSWPWGGCWQPSGCYRSVCCYQPVCCYRPVCCYQPVCGCQPCCGCQPSCCTSSCCSGCSAPACGTSPCGSYGCGASYRVGPTTEVVWKALKSEEFARNGLPRTMTKVVFAPASPATEQTAGIFHAPTRPQNRAVSRRDFGAVESRMSRAAQRLPLSMSESPNRY